MENETWLRLRIPVEPQHWPPMWRTPIMGVKADSKLGKVAYDGYCVACGGKSLISGAPLPKFREQSDEIKAAWESAAANVCASIMGYRVKTATDA
jgi:hypothetical protein